MAEDTDESTGGDSSVNDATGASDDDLELSQSDASGIAWLVVGVLVAAVVTLLLVGALIDEPVADQATELGIGFAWLLAASYVGFRIEGSSQLRLLGAGAFLFAAIAHFVSLLVDVPLLEGIRLVAVLVGAGVLLVLVRR